MRHKGRLFPLLLGSFVVSLWGHVALADPPVYVYGNNPFPSNPPIPLYDGATVTSAGWPAGTNLTVYLWLTTSGTPENGAFYDGFGPQYVTAGSFGYADSNFSPLPCTNGTGDYYTHAMGEFCDPNNVCYFSSVVVATCWV